MARRIPSRKTQFRKPVRRKTARDVHKPLIDARRIARRTDELARQIAIEVPPEERPLAVVVLQGAFIFAADLLRKFPKGYPIDVAFLRCQSYGSQMVTSGRVMLLHDIDLDVDLRGRTVILIDDILDTGLTLEFLVDHLKRRGASRVVLCVLLTRRGTRPKVKADFTGFKIGDQFVIGYGLDYDGKYRQLPYISFLPRGHSNAGGKAAP